MLKGKIRNATNSNIPFRGKNRFEILVINDKQIKKIRNDLNKIYFGHQHLVDKSTVFGIKKQMEIFL